MTAETRTRRRQADQDARERQELMDCMARTRAEIKQAYAGFNMQSDPDLIDFHVYEISALESRYSYLMRRLRELEQRGREAR